MSDRMPISTTVQKSQSNPEVGPRLVELLDRCGIAAAHFASRGTADLKGLLSHQPERVASLTVLCPAVLDSRTLARIGERLLVVTGDCGSGARRVQAALPDLPRATAVVLSDYAGLTWSDIAAERGDDIVAAIREFLSRNSAPLSVRLPEQEGEIAGISYRVRGAGVPLVLLPLDLSPGQWEPLIPALAAEYCTITLGGALLGSVASLEERGRSGYMAVVRGLLDALAIMPGESVLEVGCGSGVIMRELARRTSGANRLIGRDINPYLLREARALARREGLLELIDFGEGQAAALPAARRHRRCRALLDRFRRGRRRADALRDRTSHSARRAGRHCRARHRHAVLGQSAARPGAEGQGRCAGYYWQRRGA